MIECRYEPLTYLLQTGLLELSKKCHAELEKNKIEYAPDWNSYLEDEKNRSLGFISMREGENLVGYATVKTYSDDHRKSLRIAVIKDIYITPNKRGYAHHFMRFIEKISQQIGCWRIDVAERLIPEAGLRVGEFYALSGYKPMEIIWSKVLSMQGEA